MSPKVLSKTPKVLKALSKKTEHLREHLGEKVALCNQGKRLILSLALRRHWGYRLLVAANSATDLGGSNSKRRNSAPITFAGAFFVPATMCYGGLCGSTFVCAGLRLPRSANPVQLATLLCLAAERGGSSEVNGAIPHDYPHSVQNPRNSPSPHGPERPSRKLVSIRSLEALQPPHEPGPCTGSSRRCAVKTNTTLTLGRIQYRNLAEISKEAGCCLAIGTDEELGGNWGMFNPFAQAVYPDASVNEVSLQERVVILVAEKIDAATLRSVQRPEIDWSQLEDDEIHTFVVMHEIGHYRDNFSGFDTFGITDPELRADCQRVIGAVNEILADRYAWNAIRPGEPVPLCETGKRLQDSMAESMALLDKCMPRIRRAPRTLPRGQYAYVPQAMLMTDSKVAYVGTKVSPELVNLVRDRRRIYRRDTRVRG